MNNIHYPRSPLESVSKHHPCRVCKKTDWCSYAENPPITVCRRVEGGIAKTDCNGSSYYVYTAKHHSTDIPHSQLPHALPQHRLKPFAEQDQIKKADPEILNKVNRRLLDHLPITPEHNRQLIARGLTPEQICEYGYKSLPLKGRHSIVSSLAQIFGCQNLLKVPGFVIKTDKLGQEYLTIAGSPGLLIPVRNLHGQIIAIQVRLDDKCEGGKYRWLSSKTRYHAGPGSGCPVHIPRFEGNQAVIRLTEGPLKADVSSAISGVHTLAIPGATIFGDIISIVKKIGPNRVDLAFDKDAKTNRHVCGGLSRLSKLLSRNEIEWGVVTW